MTIKKFNLATLLCSIILSALISVEAQNKPVAGLYVAPSRLLLKGDEVPEDESNLNVLLREKFYPIGWSKDGKFAYYLEPPDEACGCYFGHLIIQDLRTDKIVWEKKYESDEGGADTLKTYWKKSQKEFSAKLAEYGIVAQKRFPMQKSVIAYQKDTLNPILKVNIKSDGSDLGATGNVILDLVSKQKGKKTLYEYKLDPEKFENFLDAKLSGSLISPFDAQAAIIMIETLRGWEGPPHVTHIKIIGASLTTGFK